MTQLDPAVIDLAENRRERQAAAAEQVDLAGDHQNAARFLAEHGADVRYSPEIGRWLVWNGAWWDEDRSERIGALANATIDGLRSWVGQAKDRDDFTRRSKHYAESARAGRREGMLAVARPDVAVVVEQLDTSPYLLGCKNGTVDLRSGELLPANRGDLITRGVSIDYDPDARSELWDDFLSTIFAGDSELTGDVQRLLGYATTGESIEHVVAIANGTGANGKTTLLKSASGVLGQHAIVAPEGLLVESRNEQHPEKLAALRGRRLVVSSELEARSVLAEGLVKYLSGGDTVSAREMYGRRFQFEPTHTFVVVTNHLPAVRGTDEAIWRRLRVVPFAVTIAPEDRIEGLAEDILVPLHGQAILAWLVAGAVAYYSGGLTEGKAMRDATLAYRQREDVFSQWLDECTIEFEGRTAVKDLLAVWRGWAQGNGVSPGRSQDFIRSLGSHGVEIVRLTSASRHVANFAKGIRLSLELDPDDPARTPAHPSPETFSIHTRRESYGREGRRPAQDQAELHFDPDDEGPDDPSDRPSDQDFLDFDGSDE
jgi:putative DNA primase/helicase